MMLIKGGEDPNNSKSDIAPPAKRHLKCCPGSFVRFHGIRTSIDREPYKCVIFQGKGGGSAHAISLVQTACNNISH